MISISTLTPKTVSNVVFKEFRSSKLGELTARVSRTGTLDGDCAITHSGVTDADRTLEIRASLTKAIADDLKEIYENNLFVNLSCNQGLFYGAIDPCNISNGDLRMKFLVKEKMSA